MILRAQRSDVVGDILGGGEKALQAICRIVIDSLGPDPILAMLPVGWWRELSEK